MNRLLVVAEGDVSRSRAAFAESLAQIWSAEVATVDVGVLSGEPDRARAVGDILADLDDEETTAVVLTADPDANAICWEVIQRCRKPVVVVPPDAPMRSSIARVLLPLDGTPQSARAVAPAVTRLVEGGSAELLAMHVFDESTAPPFADQAAHFQDTWADEFLRRHLPASDRLTVRVGRPQQEVQAVAEASDVDLIVLGWSRRLSGGRARIVRAAMVGTIPLMLLGIDEGPSDEGP